MTIPAIPEFGDRGNLPPGVHWTSWEEFKKAFSSQLTLREGLRPTAFGSSLLLTASLAIDLVRWQP